MSYSRLLAILGTIALLATAGEAISFNEIDILPTNQLYLDDSFSVRVNIAGNTCGCKVRFFLDGEPFNSSDLYNGTKSLRCDVSVVNSGTWDLKAAPLSAGTHVLKIELVEPGTTVAEKSTTILRIFDMKRPVPTTTTTLTSTTRRTTILRTTTSTTSTTLPVSYILYNNERYAFELYYPNTWELEESAGTPTVSFSSPLEDLGVIPDIFRENVSISVVKVESDSTLASFTQTLEDSLAYLPSYKKKGSTEAVLSDQEAHQLIYEFRMAPINMRVQTVYTKRNDLMYVLTYEAEDMSYAKHLPEFNRMKDSFWINMQPTTTTTTTTSTTSTTTTLASSLVPDVVPKNLDLTPAALLAAVIFLVILFLVLRLRPKKAPRSEPPAPPKPAPASPPNELLHEEVKNEVMRRTAAVIPEDYPPLPKNDEPLIEDVKDPAYERLKRIKALEREVEEVIKREKRVKEAASRMRGEVAAQQPPVREGPAQPMAEDVPRKPVDAPKQVVATSKPVVKEAPKDWTEEVPKKQPATETVPKTPVSEDGGWQVLKQPLNEEAAPKKRGKESSQPPAEEDAAKKTAKTRGRKKSNGSG